MSALEEKFRSILAHCREVSDLVEVYSDEDEMDRFIVGLVENVGHTHVTLVSISAEGEFDGRIVLRLDEILRLHIGGRYLETIRLLHEHRGKVFDSEPTFAGSHVLKDVESSLKFAREKRIMVSVHDFDKNSIMGFVAEVDTDWVEIERVLRDGTTDGFTVLRLEDVVRVDIGGQDEQKRSFMHQVKLGR